MLELGELMFVAVVLCAISGFVGLIGHGRGWGQWLTSGLLVSGCLGGLLGSAQVFVGASAIEIIRFPTPIPGADFHLAADALSAFFLLPISLVTMLGSIYGLEYWKSREHPGKGQSLGIFYGLLTSSLAVLVLARNSVTFLVGWEGMAVSAFFLVGTQHKQSDVREAAWLYLATSHAATLSLFAMFALLYGVTGSYELAPMPSGNHQPIVNLIVFVLALIGFGLKAGVMPLHFWLPSAHAMAPSHVSAVMSGVLIKAGIYGLVRMTSLLTAPPLWWGELLLVLGSVSAVLGVAFALGQHDLKRLLAYHSIENIGIIVIGLGLAMIGRTLGEPVWIVLGLSGCLLHVWNHALFKSLLFLSAGSVIHARHTREIDHLGGLAKQMPWTAGFFLLGAAAICGLPPLNGFISEFLIYLGLFHTLGLGQPSEYSLAAFIVPVLALMGALAVACFVKVFGVVFLGVSRQAQTHAVVESKWPMLLPMGVLSVCCLAIGILPGLVAPLLNQTMATWAQSASLPLSPIEQIAPLRQISLMAFALLAGLALCAALLQWRIGAQTLSWTETWGCGYTAPTARMQYTASSLAQILVEHLAWPLQLKVHRPRLDGLFPRRAEFESHVPEVVLERAIKPVVQQLSRFFFKARMVQQGSVQVYLLYIFAILGFFLFVWH